MLRAYGVSDRGRVRRTNEDCFAIDEDLRLCVVADGMGGHNAGEVAARIAVDAVIAFVRAAAQADPAPGPAWPFGFDPAASRAANLLRNAIHVANLQILEASAATNAYAGMGTTIVATLVSKGALTAGHVGDSRLYLGRRGALRQLTLDDSWAATMLRQDPDADAAVLRHHPMRHALTNVVGAGTPTQVHIVEEPLSKGDLLVLVTDGVHGVLDASDLERLLAPDHDLETLAAGLVDAALANGSRDNCTAVVGRYQ